MKIKINRSEFLEFLTKGNKIVDPKAVVPSLQGLYINVTNECLYVISSNNLISIKIKINNGEHGLEILEAGKILIKGKYIIDILRKMEDEIILISNDEPNFLFIKGSNNEFLLNLLSIDMFPEISFEENGNKCEVNANELKKSINQTIISVDEYNQKIVLTGLNFKVINNLLYIFGADQFRVSRKIIELDEHFEESFNASIPFKSCNEIPRIFNTDDKLKIIFTENHVVIKNDEI